MSDNVHPLQYRALTLLPKPLPPQVVKGCIVLMDLLVVFASGIVSYWLMHGVPVPLHGPAFKLILLAPWVAAIGFSLHDVYDDTVLYASRPKLRPLVKAYVLASGIFFLLTFGFDVTAHFPKDWALMWFAVALAGLATWRLGLNQVMVAVARRGLISQRCVIVGAGEIGRQFAALVVRDLDLRMKIVGFIDDRQARLPTLIDGYPVLGTTDDLVTLVRQEQIDQVFVALPWSAKDRLQDLLSRLAMLPVPVKLAPDLINFHFPHRAVSMLSGLPMLHVFDRPISGWSSLLKAAEDRVIAGLLILFTLPLMVVIGTAVKLDSPGPILFKQKRHGFNHRLIEVWKFRTMCHAQADANCEVQTVKNDRRVTRIGRFLRRSSLDELPQLFNVLKGDMSIVGPRPHAIATKAAGRLFEEVVHEYAARHKVKPGITGWAQVNGWRGETDTVEKIKMRVEYDLFYIENWSIAFDLWIMLKTLLVVFKDPNAY